MTTVPTTIQRIVIAGVEVQSQQTISLQSDQNPVIYQCIIKTPWGRRLWAWVRRVV